jgi:hypothetical protein
MFINHKEGTMRTLRIVFASGLVLFALLMLYNVFTVPAFAATAPAILLIASGLAAYFVWPKHS